MESVWAVLKRGLYGVYWQNKKKLPASGEEFELADYAQAAKSLDEDGRTLLRADVAHDAAHGTMLQ